jgi:hypothetical protein
MNAYLNKLCETLNIKLIYTQYKYTVLSSGTFKNLPCLRVHKIFDTCPKNISNSIVGYYSDFEHSNKHLSVLKKYMEKNFSSMKYIIKCPNENFKSTLIKNIKPNPSKAHASSNLIEYEITGMLRSNFVGENLEINHDKSIKLSSSELVDLEITVKEN